MDNEALLSRIDDYCRQYRISDRTFGIRAVNNSKIVGRLRTGGTLTLKTLHQIDEFMSRPTGAGRQKLPELAA